LALGRIGRDGRLDGERVASTGGGAGDLDSAVACTAERDDAATQRDAATGQHGHAREPKRNARCAWEA
jgi:hypothetical protein